MEGKMGGGAALGAGAAGGLERKLREALQERMFEEDMKTFNRVVATVIEGCEGVYSGMVEEVAKTYGLRWEQYPELRNQVKIWEENWLGSVKLVTLEAMGALRVRTRVIRGAEDAESLRREAGETEEVDLSIKSLLAILRSIDPEGRGGSVTEAPPGEARLTEVKPEGYAKGEFLEMGAGGNATWVYAHSE